MKIIENNSKPIKIICTECKSKLEVYKGELLEKYITLSNGVFLYRFIEECPCCKTKNVTVEYAKPTVQ